MRRSVSTLALLTWAALLLVPSAAHTAPDVDASSLDVVLAIDGTASMKSSIAQAKKDGERLVARLREVSPDLQVGVVVFRDYRNPAGEYELLQPLTRETPAVEAALERVRAVSNPDPANGVAESYALLFRKTYTDPAIGWRPGARKVVVVMGDAEPYDAGTGDLPGCRSKVQDPHGLKASEELARMRANGIVLLLVRQVSSETSAALGCYASLAEQAAVGSAARDGGGSTELVEPIVSLTKQVFAPLALRANGTKLRHGAKVRYSLSLTNRSAAPLRVAWLRAQLPRSFSYDGKSTMGHPKRRVTSRFSLLVWHLDRTIAPGRSISITFSARPTKSGKFRATARGLARLQNGLRVDVNTRAAEVVALS